jgi:hypothetical protein
MYHLLPKVQMFKMFTDLYSLAKSMMTLFMWLYKFTGVSFELVCVYRSRAQKLLMYMCVYFVCVTWFRNHMHFSTLNKAIKNVDFYRCMHDITGYHVYLQMFAGWAL